MRRRVSEIKWLSTLSESRVGGIGEALESEREKPRSHSECSRSTDAKVTNPGGITQREAIEHHCLIHIDAAVPQGPPHVVCVGRPLAVTDNARCLEPEDTHTPTTTMQPATLLQHQSTNHDHHRSSSSPSSFSLTHSVHTTVSRLSHPPPIHAPANPRISPPNRTWD